MTTKAELSSFAVAEETQSKERSTKLQYVGSIPTKVITSGKRSMTTSLADSCESSFSSDSEEEDTPRKRVMLDSAESDNFTRSKVIRLAPHAYSQEEFPESVIRVTPLRPVCSVYMVSFGQDEPIDRRASSKATVIEEPEAGLQIDLSSVNLPLNPHIAEFRPPHRRGVLETHIFADRYKTVWHSSPVNPNEPNVEMTVPFTVNVADIFNNFTNVSVPTEVKIRTYQYAVDRAEKIVEFTKIFTENNRKTISRSLSNIRSNKESRIVSTGSCPDLVPRSL